jgi:hypothetical protein
VLDHTMRDVAITMNGCLVFAALPRRAIDGLTGGRRPRDDAEMPQQGSRNAPSRAPQDKQRPVCASMLAVRHETFLMSSSGFRR